MTPNLADVIYRGRAHPAPTLLPGHNGSISFVAFLSDNQVISASDEDRTVRRWSLSQGHSQVVVLQVTACVVVTSPNRRWLGIGGRDGRVKLLDLEAHTKDLMKSPGDEKHMVMIKSLSFSPDSNQLVSGAEDGTMFVWSSTTLKQIAGPFKGHRDAVWWIKYSPNGKKIASCDREVIQIWNTTSTTWVGLSITEQAWSLAWSSDGNNLLAGCMDGAVKRYSSDTGTLLSSYMGHSDVVFSIMLFHNAKFFVTASWDRTVRLWEAVTFQQIGPTLSHDAPVHSISISPDDNLLVSGARDSYIRAWDLRAIAPALFNFFPFGPNRGPTTASLNLFRRKPIQDLDGSLARDAIPTQGHDEVPKNDDHTPTSNSKHSRKIRGLFDRKREPSDPTSHLRTPSPSTQESSSPIDKESLNSVSHLAPPYSPERSRQQVIESENRGFIDEIRSIPNNDLTDNIVPKGRNPVSGGSHGDIYRGTLNMNGRSMQVAIKVIKKYMAHGDDESKRRRLRREIKLWMKFDHRNVIPLLGTTKDYGDFLAMVCPWVENGTLADYLDRRSRDLTIQLRLCIINDVALGLQYLHSKSIVHGDISGSSILIYGSGRACIADFGLSFVVSEIKKSPVALTHQVKAKIRWTAPELLVFSTPENEDENVPKISPTVESDIYSFAGIMLHILSGKRPYHYFQHDEQVIVALSKGERPRRPSATITSASTSIVAVITDDQWEFMMQCWSFEPRERPRDTDMVAFVHAQLLDAVVAAGGVSWESPTVTDAQ